MIMFHGTNLHFQTILYIAFYPANATKSLRYSIRKRRGQMGMLVKGKLTRTFGIHFSRNRTHDDSVLHPNVCCDWTCQLENRMPSRLRRVGRGGKKEKERENKKRSVPPSVRVKNWKEFLGWATKVKSRQQVESTRSWEHVVSLSLSGFRPEFQNCSNRYRNFSKLRRKFEKLGLAWLAELKRKLRFDRRVPFSVDTALKRDSCVRDELNTAVCKGERRPLERPLERH